MPNGKKLDLLLATVGIVLLLMVPFSNSASGACFTQLQCSGQVIFDWCWSGCPTSCSPDDCCYFQYIGCAYFPGFSDWWKVFL